MRYRISGVVVAAALALAGCGGETRETGVASAAKGGTSASASARPTMNPEDARLKFTRCMRENGVDVPDPGSDKGKQFRVTEKDGDRGRMETAMKKCRSFLEAGGLMPDMNDPKVRDQLTKFAQCMRENGVDMPDPGADGGIRIKGKPGDQPKMDRAQQACRHLMPERPR
ncbi:hypothetical protein [Actinomadura flavalba]|uniref:hypothetical protein n=1 Tax=Actinomadura flavalba TaxID=1120938 RepID=UPI000367751C|nr:hypothetical protein [Actinomadura flavalba]